MFFNFQNYYEYISKKLFSKLIPHISILNKICIPDTISIGVKDDEVFAGGKIDRKLIKSLIMPRAYGMGYNTMVNKLLERNLSRNQSHIVLANISDIWKKDLKKIEIVSNLLKKISFMVASYNIRVKIEFSDFFLFQPILH